MMRKSIELQTNQYNGDGSNLTKDEEPNNKMMTPPYQEKAQPVNLESETTIRTTLYVYKYDQIHQYVSSSTSKYNGTRTRQQRKTTTTTGSGEVALRNRLRQLFLEDASPSTTSNYYNATLGKNKTMTSDNDDDDTVRSHSSSSRVSTNEEHKVNEEENSSIRITSSSLSPKEQPLRKEDKTTTTTTTTTTLASFFSNVNHLNEETFNEAESFWAITRNSGRSTAHLSQNKASIIQSLSSSSSSRRCANRGGVEEKKEEECESITIHNMEKYDEQPHCQNDNDSTSTVSTTEESVTGIATTTTTTSTSLFRKVTANLGEEKVSKGQDFWTKSPRQQTRTTTSTGSSSILQQLKQRTNNKPAHLLLLQDVFTNLHEEKVRLPAEKNIDLETNLCL